MKDRFTVIETIGIAYVASRDGDDSFINCLFHCLEIRKYCKDYLKAGGTIEEIKKVFLETDNSSDKLLDDIRIKD